MRWMSFLPIGLIGFTLFGTSLCSVEKEMVAKEAPYGSWKSPITADLIIQDAVRFVGSFEVDGNLYWGELRPAEKGRIALVRKTAKGVVEDLTSREYNARTRVYEYGGVSYTIVGDTLYFTNYSDQQFYRRDPSGQIVQLTHEKNLRFADGNYDSKRNLIYSIVEEHGTTVENYLAVVDPVNGKVRKVAEGYDFYYYPRISPDGKQLAYVGWNFPNMPWDGSDLVVAEILEDGSLGTSRKVAGGESESIYQPNWGPDGALYFVSDRSGWWNFYREKNGKVEAMLPMEAEFGFPQWAFGMGGWGFWNGNIVAIYTQGGWDYIGLISLKDKKLHKLEIPYTYIQSLSVSGDTMTFVGGVSDKPNELVRYDLKNNQLEIVKKSQQLHLDPGYLSAPQSIEFPTEQGKTAFAFYYPPKNKDFQGKKGELPPLLVLSHGGPTGQTFPVFSLGIQYWTSRGFAVIDVNYGGSTGYGREYRDRLKGNWGIVDVDDCVNAALYCVKMGLADSNRLAISGGSAGGYTTLASLAFRDVFHVGASLFGVSDLITLRDAHKFESRYNDQLVGPYPEMRDVYIARSPLYHVDQIHCPIILLQGDEDEIVPPPQSEKMYNSLLERGIPTAYLLFEKEQHGFRQAANIKRSIEATAYFFSKILGFELADQVEPVKIDNFHE